MAKIPMVKVKHGKDFCLINEGDFDKSKHIIFKDKAKRVTTRKKLSVKKDL